MICQGTTSCDFKQATGAGGRLWTAQPELATFDHMGRVYSLPEIYDIAFDFRNVPGEVNFLLDAVRKYADREPRSALEFACGPAYHVREIARRGFVSDGLDLEPAMVAYARELVAKERLSAGIFEGDMRSYRTDRRYDLVYSLIASFGHLLTNEDVLSNLNCAADLLNERGLYIVSTAHPRDFYGDEEPSVKTYWTMTRGDTTVVTDWGGSNQQFDPLTECDDVVITFSVTNGEESRQYEFTERLRRCSLNTFRALVQLSGRFEIADLLGDFDLKMPLSNDRESYRMVAVLRKQ
ncbi:MAG: class I SAM-dependent methyltransferase [Candidatus Zixiibacteriota bacterium]